MTNALTLDIPDLIYILLQLVPPGYVVTYSVLADLVSTSPRVVGAYMKRNKRPIVIPCHRVIRSDGRLGGYSMGGTRVKEKLLKLEGVEIENGRVARRFIIDSVEKFWSIVEREGYTLDVDIDP